MKKLFLIISFLFLLIDAHAVISRLWSVNYSFQYQSTSNFSNGIELTIHKTGGYAIIRKYYKHTAHFGEINNNYILIYNFSKSIFTKPGNSPKKFHLHLLRQHIEKSWGLNC
ncbi:MAG: hypothetical protein M0R02_01620 [Bacteroidales bacterium]|nr:hypothetical protein [Bacteroidales bacterium]NLK81578.1 hypothetical protein [Bacteroidales bacterium]